MVGRIAASLAATALFVLALSALAVAISSKAFGLTVSGAIALYFVIWWTLLFAVLPFGIRSQADAGAIAAGSEPGAPSAPRLCEKAVWTTLVSAAVLVLAAGLMPLAGL
jgi:predicted secreted protein